jgi:hypothetical protein
LRRYEDLAFLHGLTPEEHMEIFGNELGMPVEETCRLLAMLDRYLLLPSSSTPMPKLVDEDGFS